MSRAGGGEAIDTIAAPATGPAPAGVAIVRVSGPRALACARGLAALPEPMPARRAHLAMVRHPTTAAPIDRALVLYFPAPRSFTGEDVVEIHGHGGARQVEELLEAVRAAGARAAEPGEFSRRAVLNGRMSLEQAEALVELVEAETRAGLAAARSQLFGALGDEIRRIAGDAVSLRAELEAWLDFPEDVGDPPAALGVRAGALAGRCEALLATHVWGRLVREGARVVLAGAPNAGKSSLFNALLGEERALVDEEAGTTRDALEGQREIAGIPCTFVDTAGLRAEGAGRVEQRGIERARNEIARGGLCVWVVDATAPAPLPEDLTLEPGRCLTVWNKIDVCSSAPDGVVSISARTREGLEALERAIADRLRGGTSAAHGEVVVTRRRHAELLSEAAEAFRQAEKAAADHPAELSAYDLAAGAKALDRILGKGVDDAVLDEVFSRFCIGK